MGAGLTLPRRTVVAALAAMPLFSCRDDPLPKVQSKPGKPIEAHPSGLVELIDLDPQIHLDIRYATTNNFTGRKLYQEPRAFLIHPAAEALARVQTAARNDGFGLTIFDAYRPWRVTKALWDATPPGPKRNYVANPEKGSRHNRGCAVDLTLHDFGNGDPVLMPSGYDEFSRRAHRDFAGAPAEAIMNRTRLERLMLAQGFRGMSNEWWHFDFIGWERYAILDIPFEAIR